MTDSMLPSFDRRGFLRIGGSTVALTAVVAACGGTGEGAGPEGIASAGTRPPLATAVSATVTDVVLLRTASSLHYNAIEVAELVAGLDGVDAKVVELAEAYVPVLEAQATALGDATTDAGGEAYTTKNPVFDERVVQVAVGLLNASDTKASDAARLLHAVASLAAATHQAFVAQLVEPGLRQAAMAIGVVHNQVAAALAHVISPDNVVPVAEITAAEPAGVSATPETTVAAGLPSTSEAPATTAPAAAGIADVAVYMVPSAFGNLGPTQVVLGKAGADDSTKRVQVNIETPSLNTMMY